MQQKLVCSGLLVVLKKLQPKLQPQSQNRGLYYQFWDLLQCLTCSALEHNINSCPPLLVAPELVRFTGLRTAMLIVTFVPLGPATDMTASFSLGDVVTATWL